MKHIDWKRKLTSRKLWIAVAGFVSGLILAFGGNESTAATVSGVILQGAAVIGYLMAEGLTDAASVQQQEQEEHKSGAAMDWPTDNYGDDYE